VDKMSKFEIDKMSNDELWALHLEIKERLLKRLNAQKQELEERLRTLNLKPEDRCRSQK
jgi:hypothetical protein